MHEVICLKVSRQRVEGMYKSLPSLARGEIPVKIDVIVEPSAFREPTIEREIRITDWRDGLDLADVELKEAVITEAEAALIKERRLAAMRAILEQRGYVVTEPPPDADE
jgi:hypothetical protein